MNKAKKKAAASKPKSVKKPAAKKPAAKAKPAKAKTVAKPAAKAAMPCKSRLSSICHKIRQNYFALRINNFLNFRSKSLRYTI